MKASVVLSHQEYQALLRRQRVVAVAGLTLSEKRALARARREMAKGDFVTLEELEQELKNDLASARRR